MAMMGMRAAGRPLGIDFDYNVYIHRQPVDSQRMLLFAAERGRQEEYVSALSRRHFTRGSDGESASKRHTILAAAVEAGLEREEAAAFLQSERLRDVVWRSYGEMPRRGIQAIPLFVFNVPEIGVEGGPLRRDKPGEPPIVNGSMQVHTFTAIFEDLWARVVRHRKAKGSKRAAPPLAAAPPPTAAPPLTADGTALLESLRRRGGDEHKLLSLAAQTESAPLYEALRSLGYSKLGERIKVAVSLVQMATGRSGLASEALGEGGVKVAAVRVQAVEVEEEDEICML
ncbi:hypothetical protein AB1Y20_019316 [Prymnesium parvum]|uniref:DSBA-like thioredoxin domain-containing protein n=1 Tax=Prymnesium parvum TaxID=97485 RepID=A0AB34JR07_PRYPA|mmetsp:Transcript_22107/g.55049  ORF Transcript_22107/g.55049 Transcript_22107/m.55049 type:complete len:285 (-) Transcript_22107:232-1086(-)